MKDPQTALYRSWKPAKRLQAAFELYVFAKEILRHREKQKNPSLSDKDIELRVRSFFR
ncbi:MAG: hypothetical protein HY540_06910 [Deltaproteobacteria bacterium]|nr:hypothetical protein [Deltaproteobacteria bacterium]